MSREKQGLYALLQLGIEMESDKILDIVITTLNNESFYDERDYERALKGKRMFESQFRNNFDNESDVVLFENAL